MAALIGGGLLFATGGASRSDLVLRAGVPILGGVGATLAVLAIPRVLSRSPQRRRPGYLGFDIAALGATFAAAGRPIAAAPLVLGYLIGYLANLIPIPGGFGVLEGGLAGCLIAYGAPPTQAAAAVVVYHAIAFWIPSLGGLAGFALLRRRLADDGRDATAQTRTGTLVVQPAMS